MAWCFSTRASVATVLTTHPCISRCLTHWGRVMHMCISKLPTIGSDNGLSPGRHQAIIWTNAVILLIGSLWTNFSEILIKIPIFSFKKMRLKESSVKWRPSCLGLNVLTHWGLVTHKCQWTGFSLVQIIGSYFFASCDQVTSLKMPKIFQAPFELNCFVTITWCVYIKADR